MLKQLTRRQGKENKQKYIDIKHKVKSKMADLSLNILTITLNVNNLNMAIKRQRLLQWILKSDPTIYYSGNPLQIVQMIHVD